jgi:hypothetical protein
MVGGGRGSLDLFLSPLTRDTLLCPSEAVYENTQTSRASARTLDLPTPPLSSLPYSKCVRQVRREFAVALEGPRERGDERRSNFFALRLFTGRRFLPPAVYRAIQRFSLISTRNFQLASSIFTRLG